VNESKIAAAIPAYQAEPWVGDVVTRTRKVIPEVLVIDDCSTDRTAQVAHAAGAEVVSHPVNQGKGSALRTAFQLLMERGCAAVVTLDADGQHLPEEIPVLLDAWPDGDLILGTRSHVFAQMSTVRRLSNSLSSMAISVLAGQRLGDIQTGFRLYTRRLIEDVPFLGSRFEAESAVVVRAANMGYRIIQTPIELAVVDGRRTSHYRPLVDSLRIAVAVIGARYRQRLGIDAPT
jgi:glycosyltransferase involved in cell wall biosynthesis